MKIISLVGMPNTGKSTTLKKLIVELSGKNGEKLEDVSQAHKCKTFISPQKKDLLFDLEKSDGDFFAKIKYKTLYIGIATAGDTAWDIEHKLEYLKDCDIFICASRESGESYGYIEKLKKIYTLVKVHKIGCIGNKVDNKYRVLTKHSEELALVEIIKHLEDN